MKKFRIAECLIDGKIDEYAIFEGGGKEKIHTDEYGKYFYVPNEYNNKKASPYKRSSFTGRIKDAIQTIRDGRGDVLSVTDMGAGLGAFRSARVRYYVDRTIGEDLRAKTLEGWKNAKFAYCITMGNKNSFSGYRLLKTDSELWTVFDNLDTSEVMTFETEEDARNYAKDLVRAAREYVDRIHSEEDYNVVEAEVKEKYGKCSVIFDLIDDLIDGDFNGFQNADKSLTDFGYEINQWLVPSKKDEPAEDVLEEESEPEHETVYLYRCDGEGNITKTEHRLTQDPDSPDLLDVTPPIYYAGSVTDKLTTDFFRDTVAFDAIISENSDVNFAANLFSEWYSKEIEIQKASIHEIAKRVDRLKKIVFNLNSTNFD